MKTSANNIPKTLWALSGACLLLAAPAFADGPFTLGNFVISSTDSGTTTAPTSASTRLRLDEFGFVNGVFGATGRFFLLPGLAADPELTSTAGNKFLAPSGSAASEARVNLSADGRYLIVTGYNAAIGTAAVVSTRSPIDANGAATSGGVQRVVGRVNWRLATATGAINTTTGIDNAFDLNNIRSGASLDGTSFYVAGTSQQTATAPATPVDPNGVTAGLRYVTLGGNISTQIEGSAPNARATYLGAGRVHVGSGSALLSGFATFNPGLPTTLQPAAQVVLELNGNGTNQVITNSNPPTGGGPNATFTNFASPYDVYFADANTAYIADDRGGGRIFVNQNGGTAADATAQYFRSRGGIFRFVRNPLTNTWSQTPDRQFLIPGVIASSGAAQMTMVNENANGSFNATLQNQQTFAGFRGLTGSRNGSGNVVLFATTTDNRLVMVTDTGVNSTVTQLLPTTAGTALPVSRQLRGVAYLRPTAPANLTIASLANAGNGNDGVAPNIAFEFRNTGSTTPLRTIIDVPYPDGRVFVGDALVGTFDLGIKGFNTLRTVVPVTVSATAVGAAVSATLLPGDAFEDNSVDVFDNNLLAASFGSVAGPFLSGTDDPNFDRRTDFNYDGSIDVFDNNLLAANFGNVGDD